MKKLRSASACVFPLLVAASASAASFIVPTDRELVRAAKAIVIATAQGSYAVAGEGGRVNTIYQMRVEEVIKGEINAAELLEVVQPFGCLDGFCTGIAGTPRYTTGERALIFLDRDDRSGWSTWSLALGKFSFVRDLHGTRLLMRGQDDEAIFGWDAAGSPHREAVRSEEKFLQFVREEACGGSGDSAYSVDETSLAWPHQVKASVNGGGFHACDYSKPVGGACGTKWKDIFDQPGGSGSVSFVLVGTQTGGVNGPNGVNAGMAVWNGNSLSNVNLGVSGTGSAPFTSDGTPSIHFDDTPNTTGPCGGAAVGCTLTAWFVSPFTFDGGTFQPLADADVAFKAAFTGNQALFDQVAAHELGHAIGFRHSNEGTPNLSTAIMMSVANASSPIGANPQQWDTDAVQTIYNPSPGVVCTPPSVTSASATPPTITSGSSSTLNATASGSGPLTFQWYRGNPTDTSNPAGAAGASISVSPTVTTNYWVRVTGQCSPPSNSAAVTVTVQPCVAPSSAVASATQTTITAGSSTTLQLNSVNGSATLTFQWFTGNPPNGTAIPGQTNSTMTQSPSATTTYFVRVTNTCGSTDSNVVTITVACQNVQISSAFATPSSIISGASTTLRVFASGTNLTFQWFFGAKGNTSNPVSGATAFEFSTPLTQSTSFWVRVNGQCGGPVDSDTVTVTVAAECVPPSNAVATANPTAITPGGTTNLSATANGTGLTFQWFIGTPPNGTAISGATNPTLSQQPGATTTYFVRVSGQCGTPINSNPVTVTVSAACVNPSISTHPANKTIFVGTTATLTAAGAGTAPLHYQWFEGATGDTSKPRGTDSATFTSAPLMKRTLYWVRVSGNCGQPVFSNTATVDVKSGRPRPVKH